MRLSMFGGLLTFLLAFSASLTVAAPLAAAAEKPGILHSQLSDKHPGRLLMSWKGPTDATMAGKIQEAYDQYKDQISSMMLVLNSPGGSVTYGERAIAVLQEIKKSTKLYTAVEAGAKCASMCVFIYVQGERRFAAPASLWLFHEIALNDPHTHQLIALKRDPWLQIVDKYWLPAGVDPNWIANVETQAVNTNVWESGAQLLAEGANLVQKPLADEQRRVLHNPSGE